MGVASGKEKYRRKETSMAEKYNASKGQMVNNWVQSLADGGVQVGPVTRQNYAAGVAAAQFRLPPGAADKWERNYLAGMAK